MIPNLLSVQYSEADGQRSVDPCHVSFVKAAHALLKSLFVKRSHLFEENYRILREPTVLGIHLNMGRQLSLEALACYCSGDDRRAVFVSDIVLNYQYGAHPALFRADDRAEIGVEDIASFHVGIHSLHTPWKVVGAGRARVLPVVSHAADGFIPPGNALIPFYAVRQTMYCKMPTCLPSL